MSNEIIKSKTLDKLAGLVGLGAGAATAGAAGTAIGSAGILGTMGSAVGLTVAAATPVGWIVGGAALGGAAFYGASKIIGKKGYTKGDIDANRQHDLDKDMKLFNKINVKLSGKVSVIALELVEKLPNNLDYKSALKDGLEKGTMNANEVIQICCELLGEDIEKYKNIKLTTIENIESFIKISTLLAVFDKDYSEEEETLIKKKVIEYFSLDKILDEVEIKLIFKTALGSEEKVNELMNLDEIHQFNLLHTFVLQEEDTELLVELNEFLKELSLVDGEQCEKEQLLINYYEELLISKELLIEQVYDEALLSLKNSEDLYFLSDNEKKNKDYNKKLGNLISSNKAYGYCLLPSHVFAIHDSTVFGSGTDGFAFTPLGIITNFSDAHFIPYYDVSRDRKSVV